MEKRGVVQGEEKAPEGEKAAAACCGGGCGSDPASKMAEAACPAEPAGDKPTPCRPAD